MPKFFRRECIYAFRKVTILGEVRETDQFGVFLCRGGYQPPARYNRKIHTRSGEFVQISIIFIIQQTAQKSKCGGRLVASPTVGWAEIFMYPHFLIIKNPCPWFCANGQGFFLPYFTSHFKISPVFSFLMISAEATFIRDWYLSLLGPLLE